MKFSIIIPLYNKAPYVRKALESVFAQTYTDFELIIVDDGSTDDSACIVQQFIDERLKVKGERDEVKGYRLKVKGEEDSEAETNASNLSPITYKLSVRLITQSNAGVSAARNSGVATSSGDYIAFLDADDWWEPTYLEKMAQLIKDYPNAGLYASNYVYYKPGKTRVAVNNIETGYFNYPKAYYEGSAMPIWTGAAMIPRKVFEEMGGFPLGIKLGEDFLLWSKIAMQYKVAFLNEALAWYNNDIPATLRATRNLYAPEYHMLFRLDLVGERLEAKGEDWKMLIDKLRVIGLLDYWLDKRYHSLSAEELNKVDWSKQPASAIRIYKTPIWIQKVKRGVMSCGSFVKQIIIRKVKK